jgi:hypothetical protein
MSKKTFLVPAYKKDYIHFTNFLNQFNISEKLREPILEENLKCIHRVLFSLLKIIEKIDLTEQENFFLRECFSDVMISLLMFPQSLHKANRLSLRSSIENFNKFLICKLDNYNPNLSVYKINNKTKELFKHTFEKRYLDKLLSTYKRLCNYVHLTHKRYSTVYEYLDDVIVSDNRAIIKLREEITLTVESYIMLLLHVYQKDLCILNAFEKNDILLGLNKENRKIAKALLNI